MGPFRFTSGENLAIARLQPVGAVSTPSKVRDVLFLATSILSVDSAPQPCYRVYFIGTLLAAIVEYIGFEETDSETDIGLEGIYVGGISKILETTPIK